MKHLIDSSGVVVSLERGERLLESLVQVAKRTGIKSASLMGIGALSDVTLGYYDLSSKDYWKKDFRGNYELVSCLGNIAMRDGEPFVHAHASISGPDYRPYAGHLFEATISVVGEFVIWPVDTEIHRTFNETVGLAVWDLEGCEYVN